MFGLSTGSAIIDFCIGMSFFYLILTLICTMINEYAMDKFAKLRQKTLLEGIAGLFYDVQKIDEFYQHPLITGLYDDQRKGLLQQKLTSLTNWIKKRLSKYVTAKTTSNIEPTIKDCVNHLKNNMKSISIRKFPTYIPSRTFATALLDIVIKEAKSKSATITPGADSATIPNNPLNSLSELRRTVDVIKNERIKGVLLPLIDGAPNLEKAKEDIEKWFDDSMDRVSGWFKRRARKWLLVVAALVCLVLNADSFMVAKMLWQNDALRATVVKQAESYINETQNQGAGAGSQPTAKPGAANKPQPSPGAEKAKKKPSVPVKQETPPHKPGERKAATAAIRPPEKSQTVSDDSTQKEKNIQVEIQKQINKLQLPLGWVCPQKDKLEDVPCKWLKSFLCWVCAAPQDTGKGKVEKKNQPEAIRNFSEPGKPEDNGKKPQINSTVEEPRAVPTEPRAIILKIMGLFFTTLAISFGAPFWTDLLNSFVNLRKSGKVPPKAGEKNK